MTRRCGVQFAPVVGPDWRRAVAALLAISAATVAGITPARAGGNIEAVVNGNTQIADAVWSPLALPIPWRLNDQGVINNCNNGNPLCAEGVSPLTLQRAIDGLTAAFNTWQNVPTSRIAFTYAGTSTVTAVGLDNVHLITWADGGTLNCPAGVVATTPNFHLTADLTVSSANRDLNSDGIIDLDPAVYPNGAVLKAGTIVDADMAWCPARNDYVDVPLDTTTSTLDLVAVATHELGHFHGLSHSSLVSPLATMTPFVDITVDFDQDFRVLSQDDIASTSRSYPETSQKGLYGTITGRLVLPGGTTAADGVSVTAFNTATGEMTVQVFSVSRFTAGTLLPGTFRIDWLPPANYYVGVEYFDSTTGMSGGGDDDWWDDNRFNSTIFNSNVSGGANPPYIARPEFYSSPETSTDDLADQVAVAIGAGQTFDVGSIVINTDTPPAPAGATALNLDNSTTARVAFPAGFSFPFYGQSWTSVFVNDNANLTFGAGGTFSHSGTFLGPDPNQPGVSVPPRIAFPLSDLDPGADNRGRSGGPLDVFWTFVPDGTNPQNDRMEFIYLGIPVTLTTKSCTAVVRLFRSGRIEIQNRFVSAWWGITGISPGGDGTEPFAQIDITRQLPYSGSAGQAIFEHFEFAQSASVGGGNALRHANDTNGSLLIFMPNAQGGYDLGSPNFATQDSGEVLNQVFGDATHLAWDGLAGAAAYNVYRGGLESFVDTDGDGAADRYGGCLDAGLASPADIDAATPSAGTGYFYMVTARNPPGEGSLGRASSGAARPNVSPCP